MSEPVEEWRSLGAWLRRRRKALDLTQAALADRVGCAKVTIHKLETEAMRPSRELAERLARCLDLPPEEHKLFLQVARGTYGAEQLPSPLTGNSRVFLTPASVPLSAIFLSMEALPLPAPLPQGSRMPLRRNPLFVGRDADLRQLARVLDVGGVAVISQVEVAAATGLGGIGKTQLACEFVHRYGQFFAGGVFWLSFADPGAVPAEIAACGGIAGMHLSPEFDAAPLEKQVQWILTAWTSPVPRLLVFDNCEDETLLEQWRPTHGGCRVLVTSRRQQWSPALGVQAVSLDVLSRRESIALLRSFRPDLAADDADLAAIAETLGDLPLALQLAGSFLANYRHALTPAQYLARLRTPTILDDRSLREVSVSPTRHVQHVARTFEQSYERLDPAHPTDALARTLLTHAAYFAPGEPLPRWLLFRTLGVHDADAEAALQVEDALRRVYNLGLLDSDSAGNLRLHRLVAAFVRTVLGSTAAQELVEATMIDVATALNQARDPRPGLALESHLRFITTAALQHGEQAAGLYNALGMHLHLLGAFAEAQHHVERGLAIRVRVLGTDHPDTAQSLQNLGVMLIEQGQYAEARRTLASALALRERILGTDHPDTAQSLQNLGVVLIEQGQYAEARHTLERTLAIRERVLGADHLETARTLQNLAVVLRFQGEYAEAHRVAARVLEIRERVLGTDHSDTANCLLSLGLVLIEQGEYVEARRYVERALEIRQRVLGVDHPGTAWCLQYLGEVLRHQRHYAEARHTLERTLTIRERVLGVDHPDTAQSLQNLGVVLIEQGEYAEARRCVERALAIRERVVGVDHPDTAQTLQTLGAALIEQGQYADARCCVERALEIRQRVLGLDHPDTARCQIGLGLVLQSQGNDADAHNYFARAVAILERRLGPYHPQTQAARVMLTAQALSDSPLILEHQSLGYTDILGHRSDTLHAHPERTIHTDARITVFEDRAG